MSEWNLSVRLTGQGSDLARTLRTTARDARSASRDVNALSRDITRLRAEASRDIRVRLDVDAGHLRADVRAALTTAGGQGLAVNLQLADANQLRRDVQNAVRWAAWGHRIEIPLVIRDPNQLRRDVSAAVRRAQQNQTIRIRVTGDTSGLRSDIRRATTTGGGGGGDKANFDLKGLLTLAPAAIPLVAGLSANMAPLAAEFTAAGVAGAAFGIAVAGQIGPLSDAADAEKKYREAVVQHGASSKQAMEAQLAYQQLLQQMPAATQRAAVALSTLKGNFSDWSDDMARFTMEPVTNGIAVLDTLIPHLTPEVKSASTQLNRLVTVAGGAISTPGFDALSSKIASFTDGKLDELTDQVMHLMRVISSGDAGHGAIGAFVDYARTNGPAAREAIKAISQAVITLVQGAAQAGPGLLTLVTAAAKLVAALPPELVGIIISVASALKLLQLSGAGFAALAGGIARVRTAIVGLMAASAAAGGGLAGLRAAFMALGVATRGALIASGIGILLVALSALSEMGKKTPPDVDKLSTSLRTLGSTGKVSGEAARSFGKDLSGLADSLQKVTDPKGLDQVQQSIVSFFGTDSTPVKDAKANIDAVDKALANLVKNGNADLAAAALKNITSSMQKQGFSAKDITSRLDDYKSALADQKFEQELAAESMGVFGQAAQDTQAKLDAQKASADGLRQSIQALNDVNRAGAGAMNAFEQAIDDTAKAASKNAGALSMTHGELDLNSQKARDAETALRGLAASTDDAAAKAREQGKSWEYVQGIMDRGQSSFVAAAQKMGLTKTQAQALAKSYLDIPDSKTTKLNMQAEDATSDLNAFNAKVKASPGSKSVTLKTLSKGAEQILEAFGFKVRRLPNGKVTVSAKTGGALSGIQNVAGAVAALRSKTITITTNKVTKFSTIGAPGSKVPVAKRDYADGGVVDYYAEGGIQRGGIRHFATGAENHVAQIAPAGSWRVWGEEETGGESYIPLSPFKRPRSRKIAEETVRRLGGDPSAIQWNANGSVTDWRYDPSTGSLYSASDAGSAGHKTRKVKVKGKTKSVDYFDIGAVEKKLKSAAKATQSWNKDLEKVADRAGGDVAEALASMGADGMKLAHKMATGSTKYLNDMAKALRDLKKEAKASLTDYTRQLGSANKLNKQFSDNLATLAAEGFGDLAAQLAAQGDEASQQLAAAAVKDKGKASKANKQAKTANNALTSEQVAELVSVIAAIKTSKTGIHDVAATSGLGEDEIIDVATKATSQIKKSLGSRATRFLADLGKAQKGMAYANGGIRSGIYATKNGAVTFAEPSTGGEAYIPLGASKRRSAMPVLADVAGRFGVGLKDANAGRVVIIREQGPLVGNQTWHVTSGGNAAETARRIDADNAYQMRRLARGGVR